MKRHISLSFHTVLCNKLLNPEVVIKDFRLRKRFKTAKVYIVYDNECVKIAYMFLSKRLGASAAIKILLSKRTSGENIKYFKV